MRIEIFDDRPDWIDAIVGRGLDSANALAAPLDEVKPLCCAAICPDGEIFGGAIARTWGTCCEIQQVWVDPQCRRQGIGCSIVASIEQRATARGCTLVFLTTFSFQAPEFYEAQGYRRALAISGFGHGIEKFTMIKELKSAGTVAMN